MIEKYNSMMRINFPWFSIEYYPFYFKELMKDIRYKHEHSIKIHLMPKYTHGILNNGHHGYAIIIWCFFISWQK